MSWIGKLCCAIVRWRGGRHKYRDGLCARCGKAKRKLKAKKSTENV